MLYTRREIGKLALAAVPGVSLSERLLAKPDSRVRGVQIGLNVPYNFGDLTMNGEATLEHTVRLGVSGVELRARPVEAYLGAPAEILVRGPKGATLDALQKWRRSAPIDRARAFRRMYDDAGVRIEIVKFDDVYVMDDDVLDYFFRLTRALGARALSCEISLDGMKRLGQFADRHRLMVGLHGHAETKPEHWETAFSYAKYNGANVDLGHFVAGNNTSPVPFMTKFHDRITHIHVKDRKMNNGPNVPFGEGDTPITEVLQLIRDNKWDIQATIEFEYPVPPGSDRMKEMAKCIEYCRAALSS